jgi:hypothetical protein
MGVRLYSIPTAKLWHKISASFEGKLHNRYFFVRNRGLWMEKHFSFAERMKWYLTQGGFKNTLVQFLRLIFTLMTAPFWIWTAALRGKPLARLVYQFVSWIAVWHHWMSRYGACPAWILKASRRVESWRKVSCRTH